MLRFRITRFRMLAVCAALLAAAAAFLLPPAPAAAAAATLLALFVGVTAAGVSCLRFQLFGKALCRGATDEKIAALTFDDGPDPRATPALLDLLRRRGAPAAFFFVGSKAAACPAPVARAAAEGHLIGNHTNGHSNATNFFGVRRLMADISAAGDTLERIAGTRPVFFRPPVGLSNPNVFSAIRRLGLTVVGWTAGGRDKGGRTPEAVARAISNKLVPGAVIMLHDGGANPQKLVRTVELVLDAAAAGGYRFVGLEDVFRADRGFNQAGRTGRVRAGIP